MKRKRRKNESECWDCRNAYASICGWVAEGKKIWDEADKQERVNNTKDYTGKKPTYTVYIVKRCKYFDPEEGKRRIAATM